MESQKEEWSIAIISTPVQNLFLSSDWKYQLD